MIVLFLKYITFIEAKGKLLAELANVKHVALTTDCWTSINNEGYPTVTDHYISEKHKMISRVLATILMEERHTAINLATKLKEIATAWNLIGKITGVVSDNASNIKNVIKK